jgi:hypothetical protein
MPIRTTADCRGALRVWAHSQGFAIVAPALEEAIAAGKPRLAFHDRIFSGGIIAKWPQRRKCVQHASHGEMRKLRCFVARRNFPPSTSVHIVGVPHFSQEQ